MNVRKTGTALVLALGLAFSTVGCGQTELNCPNGYFVEVDEDGRECEPDFNNDGIDDEDQQDQPDEAGESEEEDDDSGNKKRRSRRSRR